VEETPPGRARRALRATSAWAKRQRDDLIRDSLIGFVVLGVGLIFAVLWDGRLADRQNQLARDLATASEVQENTRFVRQVVIDNATEKPFRGLNLAEAALSGLDLACDDFTAGRGCADMEVANLSGANMAVVNLSGARLSLANLSGANLTAADLSGADLTRADLTDANLVGVDLMYANLINADLTEANLRAATLRGASLINASLTGAYLTHVCYDDRTTWPMGFTARLPLAGDLPCRPGGMLLRAWQRTD
jgi:Pentapeptide repeats (8 copies)